MPDIEVVNLKTKLGVSFKMAINCHDKDAVTQSVKSGSYSLPVSVEVLLAGIPRKTTVLDLGAHIGTFSIAAAAFGYNVIAVEASPQNVKLLNASAQLNDFKNLRVVPAAISDRVGTTFFFENGPYGIVNTSRFAPQESFQITTLTVEELISQLHIKDKIRFIKMDIEGSEFTAVQGMSKLLAEVDAPSVFYESNGHTLYFFDKTPEMLISEFQKHGYKSYLTESKRLIPISKDYVQYSCVVDYLAVKKLAGRWRSWRDKKITIEEQISHAVSESRALLSAKRAHVARALKQAPIDVLGDIRIQDVLMRLKMDNDPEVLEAMSWFPVD